MQDVNRILDKEAIMTLVAVRYVYVPSNEAFRALENKQHGSIYVVNQGDGTGIVYRVNKDGLPERVICRDYAAQVFPEDFPEPEEKIAGALGYCQRTGDMRVLQWDYGNGTGTWELIAWNSTVGDAKPEAPDPGRTWYDPTTESYLFYTGAEWRQLALGHIDEFRTMRDQTQELKDTTRQLHDEALNARDTASTKAQEAAEDALAADAYASASAESSDKALQYRDETQALADAAALAGDAATGALEMVATHLSTAQGAAEQASLDAQRAESARDKALQYKDTALGAGEDALAAKSSAESIAQELGDIATIQETCTTSASQALAARGEVLEAREEVLQARANAESFSNQAWTARTQSQSIYESLVTINRFMVGHAYNYGITEDGNQVSICWTDPSDFVTQELATVAFWGKTRLLYKIGGFPEHENDGVVLVDSTIRDQYRETPFVHDFGPGGNYYFALFTCTTGGVWNTTGTAPRFTTDDLTWATIAMMTRTNTLLQYPGMEIGSVVDIQVSTMFPKLRYKLAHVNYDGGRPRIQDFTYGHKLFNSVWIPHLLPCLGESNDALMLQFDATELEYAKTWDELFVTGKKYYKIVDAAYVELVEGTDYEPSGSIQEWTTSEGYDVYTKNHADRVQDGNSLWCESNIRQWLNSKGSGWYAPQNEYDVNGITQAGFLTGMDAGFLTNVHPVYNITARNTVNALQGGGGGGTDATLDRVWLPSLSAFQGGTTTEGQQFSYFADVANTATLRIQRDEGGSARAAWLRSANAWYTYSLYFVNTSGSPYFHPASNAFSFLPAMCIA